MRNRSVRALSALLALALAACAGAAEQPAARYLGTYTWKDRQRSFGGFSGLEVSSDGASFRAITDQGLTIEGRFNRQDGRIAGVENGRLQELIGPDGIAIWRNEVRDAEGLAALPDGRFAVSFEGIHKVLMFDGPKRSVELPQHPDFAALETNASLEALAADAQGVLYTLPEKSGKLNQAFPVYRYREGQWDVAFTIPRSGGFLAVGMDIGPDGRLYLLERAFDGFGFRTRVRSFAMTGGDLGPGRVLVQSTLREFDNLEGLGVWRDGSGAIRLTMISDDNFRRFQSTQFVEFAVTE